MEVDPQIKNRDFVEWDTENWSKAIVYWEKVTVLKKTEKLNCLELGARNGGPSLWLASKGYNVICSDLQSPKENSIKLHNTYSIPGTIHYQAIGATHIPYVKCFYIIVFKSILDGIGKDGQIHLMQKVVDETFKALKLGGKLLFAENLKAFFAYQFFRKKLTR